MISCNLKSTITSRNRSFGSSGRLGGQEGGSAVKGGFGSLAGGVEWEGTLELNTVKLMYSPG